MRRSLLSGLVMLALMAPAIASEAWAPLSAAEMAAFERALERTVPGSITIACASTKCRALQKGIAILFAAANWKVTKINHGGLGIDGVVGLRVNSCGIQERKLKQFIESATDRKVEAINDGPCDERGDREVYLTIGEPTEE